MIDIPLWGAILFAVLIVGGAALTLLGCIGLARFDSFYARVHAPTLGTSFGMAGIIFASALYFTLIEGRPVVHEILIAAFVVMTTPVTLMLLSRAALHRDRAEDVPDVPPPLGSSERPLPDPEPKV